MSRDDAPGIDEGDQDTLQHVNSSHFLHTSIPEIMASAQTAQQIAAQKEAARKLEEYIEK